MSEENISKPNWPNWTVGYYTDNPTQYTSDDMSHLEPRGLSAVFLKILALKSGHTPPKVSGFLRTNEGGYFYTNMGGKFKLG